MVILNAMYVEHEVNILVFMTRAGRYIVQYRFEVDIVITDFVISDIRYIGNYRGNDIFRYHDGDILWNTTSRYRLSDVWFAGIS